MKEFLARHSVLFHLAMISKGKNYLRPEVKKPIGYSKIYSPSNPRKIMIVGMSESPHLHSWIDAILESEGREKLWLFPSDFPVSKPRYPKKALRQFPYFIFGPKVSYVFRVLDLLTNRLWRSYLLYLEIKRIKPTIIHFHETQHGAYIYNYIATHPKNPFVGKAILSTWGSDLLIYGRIKSHEERIRQCLAWVKVLTAERIEDFELAKKYGFDGQFIAPVYITIGSKAIALDSVGKTSERNLILIKGYQDNHGRGLNALESIARLSAQIDLSPFEFRVFSAAESVKLMAELIRDDLKINIEVLPRMPKHELMQLFESARVYLGLSISDGLSTSMVDAMKHGAFPIQSQNSAAPIFLIHGVTGGIVDPWDLDGVTNALRDALTNNDLVDRASVANLETLRIRYNAECGMSKLRKIYE